MLTLADLLDDLLEQKLDQTFTSGQPDVPACQECDGCGVIAPDVDLWGEDPESGEQLWLCLSCGS
jgi:hypothetical protein